MCRGQQAWLSLAPCGSGGGTRTPGRAPPLAPSRGWARGVPERGRSCSAWAPCRTMWGLADTFSELCCSHRILLVKPPASPLSFPQGQTGSHVCGLAVPSPAVPPVFQQPCPSVSLCVPNPTPVPLAGETRADSERMWERPSRTLLRERTFNGNPLSASYREKGQSSFPSANSPFPRLQTAREIPLLSVFLWPNKMLGEPFLFVLGLGRWGVSSLPSPGPEPSPLRPPLPSAPSHNSYVILFVSSIAFSFLRFSSSTTVHHPPAPNSLSCFIMCLVYHALTNTSIPQGLSQLSVFPPRTEVVPYHHPLRDIPLPSALAPWRPPAGLPIPDWNRFPSEMKMLHHFLLASAVSVQSGPLCVTCLAFSGSS